MESIFTKNIRESFDNKDTGMEGGINESDDTIEDTIEDTTTKDTNELDPSDPHSHSYSNSGDDSARTYTHSHIDEPKKTFMNNKLNTLDRQLIIIDNYAILNKNHIFIMKLFTALLIIMIIVYVCIQFKFLPKTIASVILSFLSVIFLVVLLITIVKNIRLYRLNKHDIYYPRHNPLDISKRLFKKNCSKPSFLEGSGTPLEALVDLLTNIKDTAVKYEEYGEAQKFYTELVYILDNISESKSYGPFNNKEEIQIEIIKYSQDLEQLKKRIRNNIQRNIKSLKAKAKEFRRLMKRNIKTIEEDTDNDEESKVNYKTNERKYNMIMIRIQQLKDKKNINI